MKICKICKTGKAVVPDRESLSEKVCVCRTCHAERLVGDLGVILSIYNKKQKDTKKTFVPKEPPHA